MWAIVARELQVPWRAAEAMHWYLGEQEIARRAGVTPFTMAAASGPSPSSHMPHPGVTSPIGASISSPGGAGSSGLGQGRLGGGLAGPLPPIHEGLTRSAEFGRRDDRGRRRRVEGGRGRRAMLPGVAELEGGVGVYDEDEEDDDDEEEEEEEDEEEGRRRREG